MFREFSVERRLQHDFFIPILQPIHLPGQRYLSTQHDSKKCHNIFLKKQLWSNFAIMRTTEVLMYCSCNTMAERTCNWQICLITNRMFRIPLYHLYDKNLTLRLNACNSQKSSICSIHKRVTAKRIACQLMESALLCSISPIKAFMYFRTCWTPKVFLIFYLDWHKLSSQLLF